MSEEEVVEEEEEGPGSVTPLSAATCVRSLEASAPEKAPKLSGGAADFGARAGGGAAEESYLEERSP